MHRVLLLSSAIILSLAVTAKAAPAGNWDNKLNATNGPQGGCGSDRFTCVLDDEAVRDNETGLVWQREPAGDSATWETAVQNCWQVQTGWRMGWHLPTIEQLSSLVDAEAGADPALPSGHPFIGIPDDYAVYWAATPDVRRDEPTRHAWAVVFDTGGIHNEDVTEKYHYWCVRG